jgi:peptidyl-prolyl cis-trans isomerase C
VTARPVCAQRADRGSRRFATLRGALSAVLLLTQLGACRSAPTNVQRTTGPLPSGVIARVGGTHISERTVAQIASAQGLSPRQALERAVPDALFALEAAARLSPATRQASERAAFARTLLETLGRDAAAQGPATEAEVQRITEERWVDLDRPVSVRISHAVAMLPKGGDPSRARSLAERIREAVREIHEPEAFLRAARAVPAGDLQVRAERLPYVTADGRTFTFSPDRQQRLPGGLLDPVFSQAANEISAPGELSPIVETRFGFHVILLEDRLPERRVPEQERRLALGPEILTRRADALRRELSTALKAKTPVEVRRDAEEQTAQLAE